MAVIQGYPVVIKQPMMLSLPANSSGYLVITIDKSKDVAFEGDPSNPSSYTWENNQVALEYVSNLVDGNLTNDDTIFTFPLAQAVANGTGITVLKNKLSYDNSPTQEVVLYDDFVGNGSFFADNVTVPLDSTKELVEFRIIWSRWISGTGALANGGYETRISGSTVREFQRLNFAYRENGEQCYKNLIFRSTGVQGHIDNNTTPSGGNDNRNIVMRKCVAVYSR